MTPPTKKLPEPGKEVYLGTGGEGCDLSFSLRATRRKRWKEFHADKIFFEARVWPTRSSKATGLDLVLGCMTAITEASCGFIFFIAPLF